MDKLLRRLLPKLDEHLSDEQMASVYYGELPLAERLIGKRHVKACWRCRVRWEDLEGRRADRIVTLYRDALTAREPLLPPAPREEFAQRLERQIRNAELTGRRSRAVRRSLFPKLRTMSPRFATCMALSLAAVVSCFFWWQQRVPDITSNTLLVRAEQWDASASTLSAGVMYQAVRITSSEQTGRQTMERSIYRDLQGKHKPKVERLTGGEEQLKSTLLQAGLDWDAPLSASGYQNWHDHQHRRADHIVRAGLHLLKLITTVPEGAVSEQSLTVQDTDFHPVQRTIAFRDSTTVEIAELDFKILPWSAVDGSVFAPIELDGGVARRDTNSPRVLPHPRMAETRSPSQLDETELDARLILNQLHADTGEQIEIDRIPEGVEVRGLVETDERKRALQAQLRTVPHLVVSLQSVRDLERNPAASDGTSTIESASMPDLPSPLQTYLLARGQRIDAINVVSQRLFNEALTIRQESKAIDDLQTRFDPAEHRSVLALATLSELIYSHHERLDAALKQERALVEAEAGPGNGNGTAAQSSASLVEAAAKNLGLCKELTQTNHPVSRSAEQILAEMYATMNDLTANAHEAYEKPQGALPLSGKK
jgi:hypothetical protein